jgi:hypothetical protein
MPEVARPGVEHSLHFKDQEEDPWVGMFDKNFLRSVFDYYFRTDPQTGYFMQYQGFIYPNNCTPKKLRPLMEWLDEVTGLLVFIEGSTLNVIRGFGIPEGEQERLENETRRWYDRFQFYLDEWEALLDLEENGETVMLLADNDASRRLGRYIVEPLFLGWYPNHESPVPEPFASQPPPYSSQRLQTPPDLGTPISLINQFRMTRESLDDAMEKFFPDLWESLKETAEEGAKGALDILGPIAIAAAFIYGFAMTEKGPGRGPKL